MARIILDSGHGGKDPGAVGNGIMEKNTALYLGLKTGDFLLKNYDCEVLYTRTGDEFIELSERARMANQAKADYFVSFHCNAGGNPPGTGFETYVYTGQLSKSSGNMQDFIHESIMEVMRGYGIKDRGKKEANFAVLRETKMNAILLEFLFVNNPSDATLLKNTKFLDECAAATAKGISNALGLKKKQQPPPPVKIQVDGICTINTGEKLLPGVIIAGVSYAPVRELSEIFGATVGWDPINKVVKINRKGC